MKGRLKPPDATITARAGKVAPLAVRIYNALSFCTTATIRLLQRPPAF
jgi:hypothetical protein